jgi:hypothetical protein
MMEDWEDEDIAWMNANEESQWYDGIKGLSRRTCDLAIYYTKVTAQSSAQVPQITSFR